MHTGRCLCGGVRFEIAGEIGGAAYCHCTMCRRASGSAFASNAGVPTESFRFVAGPELVREFESSPGKFRAFCGRCGSPLYARLDAHPELRRIRLGTLDGDPGIRSVLHVCVADKAPWFTITDDLARVDGLPG
jgi:hypothetical protein